VGLTIVGPAFLLIWVTIGSFKTHDFVRPMIQVAISPASILDEAVSVEEIDGLRLFKFTETLQSRLEALLEENQINALSEEDQLELSNLNELDRLFTYLNSRLLTPT
jgi:hypothetical protein